MDSDHEPWVTLPNRSRFDRTPNDGKFIVVSDIYPTPTTAMADLILPAAAWVEREGVFGNTERRTQQWNKMVDPPGEAREDAWAIIQVAKRMGMGNLFPWPDDNWHEPMFEEYRRSVSVMAKTSPSYAQLTETRGMVWPVVNGKETFYRYTAGYDPYVKKASGAHFYKAVGYGEKAAFWLRPYHPPAESPDKEFPFWLTTGRVLEHWHSGSMTRRIKQLHQAVPAAYVEMNRADAEEMGLKKGDRVKLVSRRGRLELPVEVDGRGASAARHRVRAVLRRGEVDQSRHARRDGQHQQAAGLQEMRDSYRAVIALAVGLLVLGGGGMPRGDPTGGRAIDRAARGRACLRRRPAGDSARASRVRAPPATMMTAARSTASGWRRRRRTAAMAATGALRRCRQCHVPSTTSDMMVASVFNGLPQGPWKGGRATPGAPPTIPHTLQLREKLRWHVTRDPPPASEIRTSHPERSACRQCHAAQD